MRDETPAGAWAAPRASAPVVGTVRVPGSKSITNRAFVLAALSDAPGQVSNALQARDTSLMVAGLRQLGAAISYDVHHDLWRVTPASAPVLTPQRIDCGLAGTVMRFLPAVAALHRGHFEFDGDAAARLRPMRDLTDALRRLGAAVDQTDALPLTVTGTGRLPGGRVEIDASASSQFVTALLLVGARCEDGLILQHTGSSLPSRPHIDMTVRMLARHGVTVTSPTQTRWEIAPQSVHATDWRIEPDLSNAMPFFAAAIVTGGAVTVPDLREESLQPLSDVLDLVEALGARYSWNTDGLTVTGGARVQPVDADMSRIGELAPTVAAICAHAEGESRLRGISHIRGHETDRIAALEGMLNAVGVHAHSTEDGIVIRPAALHSAVLDSHGDHRLATAGAILGLKAEGVQVLDIATTAKTLPGFETLWAQLTDGGVV